MTVDWTQVLVAAITTAGSVLSAVFAVRSHRHARSAKQSADVAVAASLRPPGAAALEQARTEWASLQPPREES